MTTKRNNHDETQQPKYYAFQIIEPTGKNQKPRWARIGAVFAHDDGEGETLILDSLPINFDGRIVMRVPMAD